MKTIYCVIYVDFPSLRERLFATVEEANAFALPVKGSVCSLSVTEKNFNLLFSPVEQ